MGRNKFLDELSRNLKGRIDENELRRQIDYYSEYIQNQIYSGKDEYQVLSELGAPRLIAKTIIQTYRLKDDPIRNQYKDVHSADADEEEPFHEKVHTEFFGKVHRVLIIAVIVLVIIIMLGVIFSLISILIPVFIMAAAVFVIVKICLSIFGNGRK